MKTNKIIDEDLFCNYIRSNKQKKLIKIIKKKKIDVSKLDLNWGYISQNDNLTIEFISFFKNYISFSKLSNNKNLTTAHISKFVHSLDWIALSKTYDFTLNELQTFQDFIRWEYVFFYNNNPSNDMKIFFKQKMWWLFLDDNLSIDISKNYHLFNNKILNKNTKEFPIELIETFNLKLDEYKNNLNILKLILKKQLNKLYNDYEKNNNIKQLKDIKCSQLYYEIKKDLNLKEINKTTIGVQTEELKTNSCEVQTENPIELIEVIDDKDSNYQKIDSEENQDSYKSLITPSEEKLSVRIELEDKEHKVIYNDICGNE